MLKINIYKRALWITMKINKKSYGCEYPNFLLCDHCPKVEKCRSFCRVTSLLYDEILRISK